MRKRIWGCGAVLSVLTLAAGFPGPGQPAVAAHLEVVASGLDNPRGLAVGPKGMLYVAESGRGRAPGVILGPCAPNPAGVEPVCLGPTGAVTAVDLNKRSQKRVVTGLPSLAVKSGSTASGPADIAFRGAGPCPWQCAFIAVGLGQHPDHRDILLGAGGRALGTLVRADLADGAWSSVADLAAFERENNPDGADPDGDGPKSADPLSKVESNPNGVAADVGGQIVIDAAANAVLSVPNGGEVKLLAVLPARPYPSPAGARMETVPVSAVRGPDGALYVGELTGLPFPQGEARVWRIHDGKAEVYATGFTMITDLAFGPDGSLYVLEYTSEGGSSAFDADPPGALVRVNGGVQTTLLSSADGLSGPSGLAVGPDGTLYISNHSTDPGTRDAVIGDAVIGDVGTGEVLRFRPPPVR